MRCRLRTWWSVSWAQDTKGVSTGVVTQTAGRITTRGRSLGQYSANGAKVGRMTSTVTCPLYDAHQKEGGRMSPAAARRCRPHVRPGFEGASRHVCHACERHHARFRYRGEVRADRDHTLCFRCFRAEVNRQRARCLPPKGG